MTCCNCQSETVASGPIWRPDDTAKPTPSRPEGAKDLYRPDILKHIEATIERIASDLQKLSLDIHSHPEIAFKECHAHNVLTEFMARHCFKVTKHYHLDTAWLATFTHKKGGRTIGVNSEMDALPGIDHACGHNLIAVSGVGVAIAIKEALEHFDIPGKVALLGTPAEESGMGKSILLDKGAYEGMAACLMCHPAPGPIGSVSLTSTLAIQSITVEYKGHTAHAGLFPWEGKNALDAAVLAHNNISALRQQIMPTHRVHGIIEGKDWAPNIIPDYAKMRYAIRAPTWAELQATLKRVIPCFEAAGLATGCEAKPVTGDHAYELRQNKALGDELANIVTSKYGSIDYEWGIKNASTDFGTISYALPSLHPGFAIPTVENGGNHTLAFEAAVKTDKAHSACFDVTKALAATGVRVILDDEFYERVKETFKEEPKMRGVV